MQTEIKTRTSITNINSDGGCLVLTQQYIDGDHEYIINNHGDTLAPGQFEKAEEILPDNLYAAIQAIWTPDVVAAYQAKIAANEAAMQAAMAPPVAEETAEEE